MGSIARKLYNDTRIDLIHPLLPPEVVKETILQLHSKGVMVLDVLSRKYADMLNELNLPLLF